MDLKTLYRLVEDAWDYDTSYCEDYDYSSIPSYGQCAVTSLVIHDFFVGMFYRGIVNYDDEETSHYWIVLDDGRKVDFTWDQFPPYATLKNIERVPRKRLLP